MYVMCMEEEALLLISFNITTDYYLFNSVQFCTITF